MVFIEMNLLRIVLVVFLAGVGIALEPFGVNRFFGGVLGASAACVILLFEMSARTVSFARLIGAIVGSMLGILGALLCSEVLRGSIAPGPTQSWLQIFLLVLMTYVGLVIGASRGALLNLDAMGGIFNREAISPRDLALSGRDRAPRRTLKLLDTSSIIDGRIADMAETGFLDGPLAVPEFVLVELQQVADSADGGKRQRGRRGLDVIQRMQENTAIGVQILSEDIPAQRAVDLKLIELGKKLNAKILTTDFNLNKLAQVHGVKVLNINDLANALKPVVLPGEKMSLYILKEGKEFNQGVGYLDDGTMVVVDHARKFIGKSVEIAVTSVLQTPSGKMIFGKTDANGKSDTNGRNDAPNNNRAEEHATRSEELRAMESHQPRPING